MDLHKGSAGLAKHFGLLVYRSRFLPRFLGVWLMIGCFAWLAVSFTGFSVFRSSHTIVSTVGDTPVNLFVSDTMVEGTFGGEPVSLFTSTNRTKIRLENDDLKLTIDAGSGKPKVKVEVKSDHDPDSGKLGVPQTQKARRGERGTPRP